MSAVILIVLGVIAYFTLQKEAPTPERPWRAYATNVVGGEPNWVASSYSTKEECQFSADKAVGYGYRQPAGCVYNGYQNALVLSAVNSIIAPNVWKCVVRHTKRDKFEDPVLEVISRMAPYSEGDGWKCT